MTTARCQLRRRHRHYTDFRLTWALTNGTRMRRGWPRVCAHHLTCLANQRKPKRLSGQAIHEIRLRRHKTAPTTSRDTLRHLALYQVARSRAPPVYDPPLVVFRNETRSASVTFHHSHVTLSTLKLMLPVAHRSTKTAIVSRRSQKRDCDLAATDNLKIRPAERSRVRTIDRNFAGFRYINPRVLSTLGAASL